MLVLGYPEQAEDSSFKFMSSTCRDRKSRLHESAIFPMIGRYDMLPYLQQRSSIYLHNAYSTSFHPTAPSTTDVHDHEGNEGITIGRLYPTLG